MSVTRSQKEYAGLSRQQSHVLFHNTCTVSADAACLLQRAQSLQNAHEHPAKNLSESEDEQLCSYDLSICAKPRKGYRLTPLGDLAKVNPALQASHKHQQNPYPQTGLTGKQQRKYLSRQSYRGDRCIKRSEEQAASGSNLKGYQRRHVENTQSSALPTDYMPSLGVWTGPKDGGEQKQYTLAELLSIPGMRLQKWDGKSNLLIRDLAGRPVGLMDGYPREEWDQLVQQLFELFEQTLRDLNLVGSELWHRRGEYFTKIFGISFGGGQQRPANFAHSKQNEDVLKRVRTHPAVQEVARHMDYLMRAYFPKLHSLYKNVLDMICKENPDLEVNFEGCCFAASSINFERATTFPHHDFMNLLFGQCGIFCCGDFDYTKGGHIVLWDLKLVVEFPSGCFCLLPSAMIRHSNASIGAHENRYSMTFFSASGLFRWCHNGMRSDKDFEAGAPKLQLDAWKAYRENLWKVGLELLSDK